MAKYIVPNRHATIIKCERCKTLYVPENNTSIFYEKCPICKYDLNTNLNKISLWRYNLIKWFRGGFNEQNK